jgi:hypothetical protein
LVLTINVSEHLEKLLLLALLDTDT